MLSIGGCLLAFSEILKITPKLDNNELNNMEKTLSSRFGKIAKGFGKGLKLASVAALGAAVLDKLVNPLNEVKAAIDRTLEKANEVVTNSTQFGTSTQNLLKLRALGQLKGLEPGQLDVLLTKFQGAVAQAKANPNDPSVSSVRNFVGQKDTAEAFFGFIQSLQTLSADQRTLVQTQIFGEKQVLKMAEFLQSNFKDSSEALAKIDFAKAAKATQALSDLQEVDAKNKTIRGIQDIIAKSEVINKGTLAGVNKSEVNLLARENSQIGRSAQIFTAEEALNKIQTNIEELLSQVVTGLPIIFTGINTVVDLLKKSVEGWRIIIEMIQKSPLTRGIKGLFGGGKDE